VRFALFVTTQAIHPFFAIENAKKKEIVSSFIHDKSPHFSLSIKSSLKEGTH
jgi:hypothetical protein